MGLRGPSPKPRKPKGEPVKNRRFPWDKPGLTRVERVARFLQWLPITKGKLAGRRMRLVPHQLEFVQQVYGGGMHVRLAISSLPRGNGKTGLLAALALCHLVGPLAEERGEIYSAAVDRAGRVTLRGNGSDHFPRP